MIGDRKEENFSAYATARGALYVIAKNLITGAAGSLFFISIARFLPSVSDFGLIHALQILILIGGTLSGLGLTNAATRFIPYHIGAGRVGPAMAISTLIFWTGVISSLATACIIFLFADSIAMLLFHQIGYATLVRLTSIDVFFFSMLNFSSYLLYSFHEFRRAAIVMTVNSVVKFTAAAVLMFMGLGIEGIISGLIFGDAVTFLLFIRVLKMPEKGGIRGARRYINTLRTLLDYSLPIFGSQILHFLAVNIDYYLVLSLSGLYTAGVYSPAVLIGSLYLAIIVGVGDTLLPHFSRIFGRSGFKALNDVSVVASRYVFLIFFPLGFVILSCSAPLIEIAFGQRYSESNFPTIVIVLVTTLTSLGIVFNYILMSAGYSRLFLTSTIIALLIQIIISFGIIPSTGAVGAALARAMGYTLMFLYPAYRLKRISGLHIDAGALKNGLVGSVIIAVVIFTMNYYFAQVYFLPLNLLIGFCCYLLFLRLSRAMSITDFEIINNILSDRLKMPITLLSKIVIR